MLSANPSVPCMRAGMLLGQLLTVFKLLLLRAHIPLRIPTNTRPSSTATIPPIINAPNRPCKCRLAAREGRIRLVPLTSSTVEYERPIIVSRLATDYGNAKGRQPLASTADRTVVELRLVVSASLIEKGGRSATSLLPFGRIAPRIPPQRGSTVDGRSLTPRRTYTLTRSALS
jgi:hypothetical protein